MKFQQRRYAPVKHTAVGKKGFGLVCETDLLKGQFVIEYTGEVLSQQEFKARKERYHDEGQRHFYFMTLSNTETIDAHRKGHLGRFLNHSCEPNCKPEKWQGNGELCVGIFANRDIPAGEELTFDYQMERFDQAQPCFCGMPSCSGVMGGTNINKAEAAALLEQIRSEERTDAKAFDEPEYVFADPIDAGNGVDPEQAPPTVARRGGKGRQLSEASRKLVKIIKDSKHIRDNRSMVEEELDKLTTESGRLLSPDHVLDYLRLFKEATSGNAGQAMAAQGPQGQSSGGNSGSTRYSARDLSILLEVILRTGDYKMQSALLTLGAPAMLLSVVCKLLSDSSMQATVRKALRALLALPLQKRHLSETKVGTRTMHEIMIAVAGNPRPLDVEVKRHADSLAYKFHPRPPKPAPPPQPAPQQEQAQHAQAQAQEEALTGHKRPREEPAPAPPPAPVLPEGAFADPFSDEFRTAVRRLVKERLHTYLHDRGRASISQKEYNKVKDKYTDSYVEREKHRHAKERARGGAHLITREVMVKRIGEFVDKCVYKLRGIKEPPKRHSSHKRSDLEWQ